MPGFFILLAVLDGQGVPFLAALLYSPRLLRKALSICGPRVLHLKRQSRRFNEDYIMRSLRPFIAHRSTGSINAPTATYTVGVIDTRDGSPVSDDEVVSMALGIVARRMLRNGSALLNPQATRDYLRLRFAGLQHEVFAVLYLDNRHRVVAFEELFRGTLDGATVHPREVVVRRIDRGIAGLRVRHRIRIEHAVVRNRRRDGRMRRDE